jgi:hypothetical protein
MAKMVSELRQRIAAESARLMVQDFIEDYRLAKQKAVARLGLPAKHKDLPSNSEIEQAIEAYQNLFVSDTQHIQFKRETALHAMQLLADFIPRLVGKVLNGTANPHTKIQLHVFTDAAEEVAFLLLGNDMPYEESEQCFHSIERCYPCYVFMAGEEKISVTVFPYNAQRQAPPDVVTGKAMQRANVLKVEKLIKAL